MPLHQGEILMHGHILQSITQRLVLDFIMVSASWPL